jgi:hypothetical protein
MDLPREEALRWIVARFACLRAAHGEAIGSPPLVTPTATYFPDPFEPTGDGVAQLLARTLEHAPVAADLDVRLRFLDAESSQDAGCGTGGCGTGACDTPGERRLLDRVIHAGDGYVVELPTSDVGNPVLLTTSLARSAGSIVLSEAGEDVDPEEVGPMSEMAAVVAGFGVLLSNGAYVFGKSCGGVRVQQHTHLSVEELTVALALFAKVHDVRAGLARTYLDTTPREAFAEAVHWADSNPELIGDLRDRPEVVVDGIFKLEPTKFMAGLFGRLFAGSRASSSPLDVGAGSSVARDGLLERSKSNENSTKLARSSTQRSGNGSLFPAQLRSDRSLSPPRVGRIRSPRGAP